MDPVYGILVLAPLAVIVAIAYLFTRRRRKRGKIAPPVRPPSQPQTAAASLSRWNRNDLGTACRRARAEPCRRNGGGSPGGLTELGARRQGPAGPHRRASAAHRLRPGVLPGAGAPPPPPPACRADVGSAHGRTPARRADLGRATAAAATLDATPAASGARRSAAGSAAGSAQLGRNAGPSGTGLGRAFSRCAHGAAASASRRRRRHRHRPRPRRLRRPGDRLQ